MKKILIVLAVLTAVVMTGTAMAAPPLDVPVNVSATVTQKCVVASPGALVIAIDPASAAATQAFTPTQPSAKCTKTKGVTTAAVVASSPSGFNLVGTAGEANIPYTFTYNAAVVGNGFGAGADVNFGIGGSVTQAAAQAADFGSYTDTITLTLTY